MPSSAESYTLLAKQAKGKALVHLIHSATSDKDLFTFAPLLAAPHLPALRASTDEADKQAVALLDLFAFGDFKDYSQGRARLPDFAELPQAAVRKLKLLSLVSLFSTQQTRAYTDVQQVLDLDRPDQVEELVTEAVYASLLTAKLNSADKTVFVQSAVGRDVRLDALPLLTDKLTRWLGTCANLLTSLDQQMAAIEAGARERTQRAQEHAQAVADVATSLGLHEGKQHAVGSLTAAGLRSKRPATVHTMRDQGSASFEGGEAMEVEEAGVGGSTRKRKNHSRRP